jgi:membrane protease YdiL (CAAX protease family)
LNNIAIILISSIIFLLNHIYRLNDGYDVLLYIFLLGIILIIPLIYTNNLWITGFMHWTGNSFFFVTHNVILTQANLTLMKPNILFSLWIMVYIPIVWLICKKISRII